MSDIKTMPDSGRVPAGEENKDQNIRYSLSNFEHDLYHEESDVVEKIIRVKRLDLPNKGERWKIFSNSTVVFVVEGNKLTKKEREFLRTVDGVNFLISRGKQGVKSFNSLRNDLKKNLK